MEASEGQSEPAARPTRPLGGPKPLGPPSGRPAKPVLVVELDEEEDARSSPRKAEGKLDVAVSATAPAVIVPAAPRPCPGAGIALMAALAALLLCFLPVTYIAAVVPAGGAIVAGVRLLRRIRREPYLTGRGMVNTAILLGVVSATFSVLRLMGNLLFWTAH